MLGLGKVKAGHMRSSLVGLVLVWVKGGHESSTIWLGSRLVRDDQGRSGTIL